MNAYQRRKLMRNRHYTMPLKCEVVVDGLKHISATLFKHDYGHRCIVMFADGRTKWLPYSRVVPLEKHRRRPWWAEMRIKRRA